MLEGKTILLTGGTGSFGTKFTEIALRERNPEAIRIFSRGEHKQAEMRERFDRDPRLRYLIGDVRDKDRLSRAMNGADLVVHAAALKRVPAAEYNPIEAKATNIDGAANIIDAAIDNNVENVLALSTDKAVHPINLYGATKLVAEKLFVQGNAYSSGKATRFSVVRYGNVFGSQGSVLPLFIKQREQGTLTITHEDMTRFWITLDQGVQFVLNSIERMKGGEIFVPKIPSMKITALADAIAPEADRKITGIRPGEKLDEVLLTEEEARHAKEFEDHFIIEPEHPYWNDGHYPDGKTLPDGFRYTSGTNDRWLKETELRTMIEEIGYSIG